MAHPRRALQGVCEVHFAAVLLLFQYLWREFGCILGLAVCVLELGVVHVRFFLLRECFRVCARVGCARLVS